MGFKGAGGWGWGGGEPCIICESIPFASGFIHKKKKKRLLAPLSRAGWGGFIASFSVSAWGGGYQEKERGGLALYPPVPKKTQAKAAGSSRLVPTPPQSGCHIESGLEMGG